MFWREKVQILSCFARPRGALYLQHNEHGHEILLQKGISYSSHKTYITTWSERLVLMRRTKQNVVDLHRLIYECGGAED